MQFSYKRFEKAVKLAMVVRFWMKSIGKHQNSVTYGSGPLGCVFCHYLKLAWLSLNSDPPPPQRPKSGQPKAARCPGFCSPAFPPRLQSLSRAPHHPRQWIGGAGRRPGREKQKHTYLCLSLSLSVSLSLCLFVSSFLSLPG